MESVDGPEVGREPGASEADGTRDPLRPCTACGQPIAGGSGRFNVGPKRYHVDCFDPTRHMTPIPPPGPSA
jgi:hypothetical protein